MKVGVLATMVFAISIGYPIASFAGLAFEGLVIDTDHWRHFFIIAGIIWGIADALPVPIDQTRRRDDPVPESAGGLA